jgi:predicted AAA+ superfamily ATPase
MKTILKRIIVDNQERSFSGIFERSYNIPLNTKKIVSLIGVRRSGKTFELYNLINKLRKTINSNRILFINFEDDRLYPFSLELLNLLIESYYELYPQNRKNKIYIFLDEIQNIDGWELFVRRIHDTLNAQIFITGSSSKLLSKEIATSLRGRTISYEVFPFSFKEFLNSKNININLNSSNSVSYIKKHFDDYLINGGFAETFDEEAEVQKRILKDYLDLIVYKDLVERYSIKNQSLVRHLIKYLFVNMGTLVSFTKLFNQYKSLGYKVSKDTLFDYMSYLEDSYTLFTTPIHRNSVKEENRHPKKIFAIDNGFKKLFDINYSEDYSKLYENLVFLHLRRKTNEIYYAKQKQEIDFYVKTDQLYLINVSYDINDPQTFERETSALLEGMNYYKVDKSILITAEREETYQTENKTIHIIPLWKWLIMDNSFNKL